MEIFSVMDDENLLDEYSSSSDGDDDNGKRGSNATTLIDSEIEEDSELATSTFIESKYFYEYIDEDEINKILESVDDVSLHSASNSQPLNDDQSIHQQQQNDQPYDNGGGGDAVLNVQAFRAQLVHIRIRPQYIEYVRAKRGWSSICKFTSKSPQQYIQIHRCLLNSPSPQSASPASSQASMLMQYPTSEA